MAGLTATALHASIAKRSGLKNNLVKLVVDALVKVAAAELAENVNIQAWSLLGHEAEASICD